MSSKQIAAVVFLSGILQANGYTFGNCPTRLSANCNLPYENIGGRCLLLNQVAKGTWQEMRVTCEQLGGQLLKMDDANLLYEIVQYIKKKDLPDSAYWIGGSDIEKEGHFVHLDGTPMKMGTSFWGFYTGEGHQQPDNGSGIEDCVTMNDYLYYYLNDDKCNRTYKAICEELF